MPMKQTIERNEEYIYRYYVRCLLKKPHSIFQCDDSKVDPQLNVLKAIRTAVGGVCIANCF